MKLWPIKYNGVVRPSGVARAFPGGQAAHLEDQNKEENEENLRKNERNYRKISKNEVRPLPALPGVIANAFQCNGCVRLPNFDLLIISFYVERILVVSYWFTTDRYAVTFKRVNVINTD